MNSRINYLLIGLLLLLPASLAVAANSGTIQGSPSYVTAASGFGQAIATSAGNYVSIPNAVLPAAGTSWTIRCRGLTTATALQIAFGADGNGGGLWLGTNTGKPTAFCYGFSGNLVGATATNDGNWHDYELTCVHVAGNSPPDTLTLYADGAVVATQTGTYAGVGTPGVALGRYGGTAGYDWTGDLDEVAVFSAALHTAAFTPPTAPTSNTAANLVSLYHLDGNANDSAGVVTPYLTFTPVPADLWDNAYSSSAGSYYRTSPMARFVIQNTDATGITFQVYSENYSSQPQSAAIGLRYTLNGVVTQTTLACTQAGTNTLTASLPAGIKSLVECINGATAGGPTPPAVSNALATYIQTVALTGGTIGSKLAPAESNLAVVYGDSIAGGFGNAGQPLDAWPELLRATYNGNVLAEQYGGRALFYDAGTPAAQTAFIAHLVSTGAARFVFTIGTNDYGEPFGATWSPAGFAAAYAAVIDGVHASLPAAVFECVTPLPRGTETANGFGNTLGDYRNAIATLCASRPYCRCHDGTRITTLADLNSDQLHPTTAGQVKIAAYMTGMLLATPATYVASSSGQTTISLSTGVVRQPSVTIQQSTGAVRARAH